MLQMDRVHVIRYKVLVEKKSQREVAREMGHSRNTIAKYLEESEPKRKEPDERPRPVRERVEPRIRELLEDRDRVTSRKQRWTAYRLVQVLAEEGLTVSERTARRCMADWRRDRAEVYLPLVYRPGELAEVDFFEVRVDLPEGRKKCWLFVMREMYSGFDFACIYEYQDQVCFLDAHVRAFEHLGGVPQRIAYDNLRPAVRRIMVGGKRELASRFQALASHYLFEPCFARPATGHDKGGVEARGKGIRLRHLTPIPYGKDLEEVSTVLQERLDGESGAVRQRFDESRRFLHPLPERPFRAFSVHFVTASPQSLVRLRNARYSVPEEWARSQLEVHLYAREVEVICGGQRVRHQRIKGNEKSVSYLHYLRELSQKPQALRQVAPELLAELGEPFGGLWRLLVDQHGGLRAARLFKGVLRAIIDDGLDVVRTRLTHALQQDDPLLYLLGHTEQETHSFQLPAQLKDIEVAGPCVLAFDTLLGGKP